MDARLVASASGLRRLYERRELSPVEVVTAALEQQAALQEPLNAFVTPTPELALVAARTAEAAFAGDAPVAPLAGIPVAVKDIIDVAGVRCTRGSAVFADRVAPADAAVVAAARAAGAAIVGKAATHEFAWGITSENATFGNCRNPWDRDRIPGGSSGGSAVAVATGQAVLGLGTDTAGSVRIPAAFCGIVGFKPTYGLLTTEGIFPLAPSLDHAGLLGRDAADVRVAFEALLGRAARHLPTARVGLHGVRVGVLRAAGAPALQPDAERLFADIGRRLAALGAEVRAVAFSPKVAPLGILTRVQPAEALHAHTTRGLFPARAGDYGADVRGRLEGAAGLALGDYLAGQDDRARVTAGVLALFDDTDLLLSPVAPAPPPYIGDTGMLRDAVLPHTVLQNLAGVPACAFPIGHDGLGLPVGAQLSGPRFADRSVLAAVHELAPVVALAPG